MHIIGTQQMYSCAHCTLPARQLHVPGQGRKLSSIQEMNELFVKDKRQSNHRRTAYAGRLPSAEASACAGVSHPFWSPSIDNNVSTVLT